MEFKELEQRAQEILKLYNLRNVKQLGAEWTRLQLTQGFAGDVGELQKLAMAKDGLREIENVDAKLAHELSDCLWSVLVLADKFNIDLEKSFLETMNELEKKLS